MKKYFLLLFIILLPSVFGVVCNETYTPCGGGCNVTDLSSMFVNVTNFDTVIGNISGWNTSCITIMNALFYQSDFNQNINSWDVSQVTDFNSMFWDDTVFNQPLNSWSINANADTSNMFRNAQSFNQPLSQWNTSGIGDFSYMFYNATAFNQNIGSWNMENLNNADHFLVQTNLSFSNYDALLNGWALQNLPYDISIDFGNNTFYSSLGLVARNTTLIGFYNWIITDGGVYVPPPCVEVWNPILTPSQCLNGSQFLVYEDLNTCNTTNDLPVDNGTSQSCSIDTACGEQLCLNPVYAHEQCCIVTPTITCNQYTYSLYNNNGSLMFTNNLTLFNEVSNTYFFYFNQPVGTYYIKACDDSTRQVNVVAREQMLSVFDWTIIIFCIMMLVTMILGLLVNPLFFGGTALMFGVLAVHLYGNGYPSLLIGACGVMMLFFVTLGFFMSKRNR